MSHVPFACRCSHSSNVVDDNVGVDQLKQMAMKMAVGSTARLGWKTTRDEELEQSCRARPKNLIHPLPYRIAKASGSGDLLSCSPVHAGARDGVDYRGGASSERWQNPRLVPGCVRRCRARVYIGTQRKTLGNMGHAHVARPSRLQQPTIREQPEPASCDVSVKDSVKRSVFLCSKKISSALRLNSTNRGARTLRDVSRRDERARRRRSARVALLFSLTYQVV
jgi:hypothetical protein